MPCYVPQGLFQKSQKCSHCVFTTCFIPYRTFVAILKNLTVVIMTTVSLEDVLVSCKFICQWKNSIAESNMTPELIIFNPGVIFRKCMVNLMDF